MTAGWSGIVIEGIPCAGKSCLLAEIRAHPTFLARQSVLMLSEHYTERAIEGRPDQRPERYEQLMYRLLAAIEPLRVLTVESDVLRRRPDAQLLWVLERFHFTNLIRHANGDLDMLRRIEGMMRFYRPTTVVITVPPEQIEAQLAGSLDHRNVAWRDFVFSLGPDLASVAQVFTQWQEQYLALAEASTLPTMVVPMGEQARQALLGLIATEPTA
ncbi:MAG: hypothetical protein HZB16_22880 [Armatimonadetes bacterium]|nr:hypothetical protein [Armatimonadota bacterium]